jgi:hypothetical protein
MKPWGAREQRVLDAWRARAGAGAVPRTIADELAPELGNRAYKAVLDAVKKLEAGGALVAVEKVPTPTGGPPATRYVAAGAATVADVAVAQAEALLRSARPQAPSSGAQGAAG